MESGGGEKGQPAQPAIEDNQPDAGHDSQPKFRALFAYSGQHEDELSFQVSRFCDSVGWSLRVYRNSKYFVVKYIMINEIKT